MKILVVEDHNDIREMIKDYFEPKGVKIVEAWNGLEGIQMIDSSIDLVLLDILMPGIDGYEVCTTIRENYDVPIVMMSALSQDDDQLKGYDVGVDDYVTKPFKLPLLYAKCMNMIKRRNGNDKSEIVFGKIILDTTHHILIVDNEKIDLTDKEYQLLFYFMKHSGKLLTREHLLDALWGYDYLGDGRIIDSYIKRIRKHLGPYHDYLRTVRKSGYILEVVDDEDY